MTTMDAQCVLIIDDDVANNNFVSKMLKQQGLKAVQCKSIDLALDAIAQGKFKFVIMSLAMISEVGLCGIKLLRHSLGDIKIIVMSADWVDCTSQHLISVARKEGANWALPKPFDADQLNEAIACICRGIHESKNNVEDIGKTRLNVVVVVEDDPVMGLLLRNSLDTVMDGQIEVFDNAINLLTLLQQGAMPDLILSDLNMPNMDGLELMRHLAAIHYHGAICLVSGEEKRILKSAEALAQTHGLNVIGALTKPVLLDDMAAVIKKTHETSTANRTFFISPLEQQDICRGLKADEFEVHYQPKVSTLDRSIIGVEALVRWRHPDLGLLFPDSFIPCAEKHNLIDDLTMMVIKHSLKACRAWRKAGLALKISINLSPKSFHLLNFPEMLHEQAQLYDILVNDIIIEITENRVTEDTAKSLEIMSRLRLKGFGLSIDDFGTGQSSFSRLKQAPFSELKIDQSFVAGATQDEVKRTILETSAQIAQKLGVTSVAEGVETLDDWQLVKALKVDLVQGYFIAKPMDADTFFTWSKQWRSSSNVSVRVSSLE